MAAVRQADATWSGNLTDGKGTVSAASSGVFSAMPTTWASRVESADGRTSPEELLAAAHASCFSMAFSNDLFKRGFTADRLAVTARVTLDQTDAGRRVISSALTVTGSVPGIDAATFAEIAEDAKNGCPISNAIKGNVALSVEATLES
ncbi:MAG TPA: OsmC family peroxiredoxin [Candidatus Limnocylindrales bacterium]|nr:OsmC family peroxiredoxin [Candidatus Limnocylindrales bacterium]